MTDRRTVHPLEAMIAPVLRELLRRHPGEWIVNSDVVPNAWTILAHDGTVIAEYASKEGAIGFMALAEEKRQLMAEEEPTLFPQPQDESGSRERQTTLFTAAA